MREYLFDVKLFASVRVKAENEQEARRELAELLDCATVSLGRWIDGEPVIAEASMEGEPDLIEVDGDSVYPE